jgi:ribosomal protein S18 acetylase RimI-like enzyme
MPFFYSNLDVTKAKVRFATEADLNRLSRLFCNGARCYYGFTNNNLPSLLATMPATILEAGPDLWATALVGWSTYDTTWLQGVALAKGIQVGEGLELLLPPLHHALQANGLARIFYAADQSTDAWLLPSLQKQGYVLDTEVVVYQKEKLNVPAKGNLTVQIRAANLHDLPVLTALDHSCFEAQWTKDKLLLSTAIMQGPFFIVAELARKIVGYAYATSHFGGHLVHLVRLAVRPQAQGQGIGVRLLAEVVTFARQQNADLLTLNTQAYNHRAQRLYEKFGFLLTDESQPVLRYDL